ncbi:MAG: hypothetical protein OEY59_06995 [Deltaproteobacteria bacterium]|nr:hypothetical protein [Deltaproteobacteria bacterium]
MKPEITVTEVQELIKNLTKPEGSLESRRLMYERWSATFFLS